jgi:hypothetical protein
VQRVFLRTAHWQEHHGIHVSATAVQRTVEAAAVEKVFAALDLLHAYAPAHLARMPSYMHGITVTPLQNALGTWLRSLGLCLLDEAYIVADHTSPEEVAATIVHELTHARLEYAGVPYVGPSRARCERICFLAERNWACRLPASPHRDALDARIAQYLAIPAEHWSDAAIAQRVARKRMHWPWWQRAIYVVGQFLREVRGLRAP